MTGSWSVSWSTLSSTPMFTLEERVDMIRRVTEDLPNVEVEYSDGLLAEYARSKGKCVIVKGLRAGSDFENEFQMALINHKINPDLDTMFLTAEHQYMYLSSSMVKELGSYDVDLSDFLPEAIIPDFQSENPNSASRRTIYYERTDHGGYFERPL